MRLLVLPFLIIAVISCDFFHNGRTPVSEWDLLDRASHVKCASWPQAKEVLTFNKIQTAKGPSAAFFAASVLRTGEAMSFLAPFDGSYKIDQDSLVPVKFGKDDMLLGITQLHAGLLAVSFQITQDVKGAPQGLIEVRSLPNNVVLYKTKPTWSNIADGALAATYETFSSTAPNGFWVTLKDGASDSDTFEDQTTETKVAFLKIPAKGAELEVQTFNNLSFPSEVTLLPMFKQKSALAVYYDHNRVVGKDLVKGDVPLMVQELFEDGRHVAPKMLGIKVESNLESWAAMFFENELYIAYIDGDTMVGRANLKITKFQIAQEGMRQLWTRGFKIDNIHVSEPLWIVQRHKPHLFLLEWLDNESTLSSFPIVPETGISEASVHGVFPKGSRIEDTLVDASDGHVYMVMRTKNKELWNFEVCDLSEL